MTIYVNKIGDKFMNVQDSEFEQSCVLQDLKNMGYHLPVDVYKTGDNGYKEIIDFLNNHLTLYQKVQLCDILSKAWGTDTFHIKDAYAEYMDYHDGDEGYTIGDFLNELETGDECILDSCKQVFEDIDSFKDYKLVFKYLDSVEDPKHWHSWLIYGYSQGDCGWVWFYDPKEVNDFYAQFIDDKVNTFIGEDIQDELTQALYGSYVSITPCNNKGVSSEEQDEKTRYVASHYVGFTDSLSNKSDQYVDEYMSDSYDMKPAKVSVTYSN